MPYDGDNGLAMFEDGKLEEEAPVAAPAPVPR